MGRPAVHPCGTYQAAARHRYRNEPICAPCRLAERNRSRDLYRAEQAAKGRTVQPRPRKPPLTLHSVAQLVRQRVDIENVLKIGPDVARALIHACRQNGLL